jgi:archaellum biogenesis protein FlaJ (TadC family)
VLGLGLLPSGIYADRDNSMVGRIDKETAPFIRSLGNEAESLGSTVSVALEKVDRRSLDALEPAYKPG